jgi:hypothetical protein
MSKLLSLWVVTLTFCTAIHVSFASSTQRRGLLGLAGSIGCGLCSSMLSSLDLCNPCQAQSLDYGTIPTFPIGEQLVAAEDTPDMNINNANVLRIEIAPSSGNGNAEAGPAPGGLEGPQPNAPPGNPAEGQGPASNANAPPANQNMNVNQASSSNQPNAPMQKRFLAANVANQEFAQSAAQEHDESFEQTQGQSSEQSLSSGFGGIYPRRFLQAGLGAGGYLSGACGAEADITGEAGCFEEACAQAPIIQQVPVPIVCEVPVPVVQKVWNHWSPFLCVMTIFNLGIQS